MEECLASTIVDYTITVDVKNIEEARKKKLQNCWSKSEGDFSLL